MHYVDFQLYVHHPPLMLCTCAEGISMKHRTLCLSSGYKEGPAELPGKDSRSVNCLEPLTNVVYLQPNVCHTTISGMPQYGIHELDVLGDCALTIQTHKVINLLSLPSHVHGLDPCVTAAQSVTTFPSASTLSGLFGTSSVERGHKPPLRRGNSRPK